MHGETGLVVAPDPAQLAAAWRSLLESAPLRQRLGAAARRRAERCFSPARLAEAGRAPLPGRLQGALRRSV